MKTVTRAKLSIGFCLSLLCLGTSHANDNLKSNDIKILISATEDALMKNPSENSEQFESKELKKLEEAMQNTIGGKFNYSSRNDQNKFTHLSANKALENKELFSVDDNYAERLKKIQQMQNAASYISKYYRVGLKTVEEIVLSSVIEAEKKDLSPALLLSLISVESTFQKDARSHMGAMGLTQVIPKWHPEKIAKIGSEKNLHTIRGGIRVGVEVLDEYLGRAKGNVRVALQMYNGSLKDKNNTYSKKVFARMEKYKTFFES